MSNMFRYAEDLRSLNLDNWELSNALNISYMFTHYAGDAIYHEYDGSHAGTYVREKLTEHVTATKIEFLTSTLSFAISERAQIQTHVTLQVQQQRVVL